MRLLTIGTRYRSASKSWSGRMLAVIAVFGSAVTGQAQAPAAAGEQVTFAKDVMPILQESCQNCHRPNSIGPMPLLTYENARPWARAIKEQVTLRNMPPWYLDRHVGIQKFKNDISLSDKQIATIAKWADEGAPLGNPADMPPPKKFDDNDIWHIGKPDVIVKLPEDLTVKAKGPDSWYDLASEDLPNQDRSIRDGR